MPQYPVYQLPFKGQSTYKDCHNKDTVNAKPDIMPHRSTIDLKQMVPHKFSYETSKQHDYKGFQMQQRPQTAKPKVDAVRTKMPEGHYNTGYKNEFIDKKYRIPEVDLIPYP
jgi:hypothetical protein